MRPVRVLLTGATGFIGSRVLHRLRELQAGGTPLGLHTAGRAPIPGVDWRRADLADVGSLEDVVRDVDVLVHLASRVSGDEAVCRVVNHLSTEALMAQAVASGVRRIVHLSTTAVYGPGPHGGPGIDEIAPSPVSPASRTRLEGEKATLASGGTVLRPGLITGAGDRWVVPALDELLGQVPARWNGGRGLMSMVDVGDLARLIVALIVAPGVIPTGAHHASHPAPVRNADLMAELSELDILPAALPEWSWQQCLEQLRSRPGGVSERQFALLAGDHWYRDTGIWEAARCPAGPGPLRRLTAAAPWYRSHLTSRRVAALSA
ncbi:NAD(P)-dependent oxidoreductase [Streptomyces sp. NPDC095613]|uniref:NAD-dependent epimerase/dehydratase family protein n=1 Tax=Streptomyces sp. NPDC095613 TaxID=3155540 RepID=UPI003320B6F8